MSGIFPKLSVCQKFFRGISGSRSLHKTPPVLNRDSSVLASPLQNTEGSKNKPPVLTLSHGAIFKHIDPDCKGREDAEKFYEARRGKVAWSKSTVNTLLVADVKDFHQDGNCVVSNIRVPYYNCRYDRLSGYFQVLESYFVLYVCIY